MTVTGRFFLDTANSAAFRINIDIIASFLCVDIEDTNYPLCRRFFCAIQTFSACDDKIIKQFSAKLKVISLHFNYFKSKSIFFLIMALLFPLIARNQDKHFAENKPKLESYQLSTLFY